MDTDKVLTMIVIIGLVSMFVVVTVGLNGQAIIDRLEERIRELENDR